MSKSHPEHYQMGSIEPIDYILDHDLDFCLGNVIKYVTRAGHKAGESKADDLIKAQTYLAYAVKRELERMGAMDGR